MLGFNVVLIQIAHFLKFVLIGKKITDVFAFD